GTDCILTLAGKALIGAEKLVPRFGCRIRSNRILLLWMKTLSVTEFARNFRKVLDAVEHEQEEIVLVRNRRQVARLVPEAPYQNALEAFGDPHQTLDEKSADALSVAVRALRRSRRGRLSEVGNPFEDIPGLKTVAMRLSQPPGKHP